MKKITKTLARKVLTVVDAGLCNGVGTPIPGQMCVEAAVCFALDEPHGDKPTCVNPVLRRFKIALNDKNWSSSQARAKGLRRIAIAQLGTADNFDEKLFLSKLLHLTRTSVLPKALRAAANLQQEPHKAALLEAADECEKLGTIESVEKARTVAHAAKHAAYAAYAAAAAAAAAADAAYAAADAAYAAAAASYAAADAAYAARDKVLSEFAEDVVQILIEMKTPGSKFLFLTEVED